MDDSRLNKSKTRIVFASCPCRSDESTYYSDFVQPRTRKVHAARIINSPPSLLRRNLPVLLLVPVLLLLLFLGNYSQLGHNPMNERSTAKKNPDSRGTPHTGIVYTLSGFPLFATGKSSDLFVVITGKSMASTMRCGLENSGKKQKKLQFLPKTTVNK